MKSPEKTEILDVQDMLFELEQTERDLLACYSGALGEGLTRSMREAIFECMASAAEGLSAILEEKNYLFGKEPSASEKSAEKLYKDLEKMQKKLAKKKS